MANLRKKTYLVYDIEKVYSDANLRRVLDRQDPDFIREVDYQHTILIRTTGMAMTIFQPPLLI